MNLLNLANNDDGFSIVRNTSLREYCESLFVTHISNVAGVQFNDIDAAAESASKSLHEKLKEKNARLLSQEHSKGLFRFLQEVGFINYPGIFVTDEEDKGFPNFYWRVVRANQTNDVGPVHADKWFWDLGHGSFPKGFERVKVWVPILQDNNDPSLLVLPGSHKLEFSYGYRLDQSLKKKPFFSGEGVLSQLISAPVKTGDAIIFNDKLLHGGKATSSTRISIEWTFGCPL
jgi:hypothetical protein